MIRIPPTLSVLTKKIIKTRLSNAWQAAKNTPSQNTHTFVLPVDIGKATAYATLPVHIRMCIYIQTLQIVGMGFLNKFDDHCGRLQPVPDDFSSVHRAQLLVHGRRVND